MTIIARDDVEPDDTALYFVRGIDGCSEIEALAPDDRHAGAYDVARVVAAVTVVSVLSYVGLGILHGLGSVSRGGDGHTVDGGYAGNSVFRFGFRGLRSYLSAVSNAGRPVAIYGATEEAADLIRMLRSNRRNPRPVAVVDEREEMHGTSLLGVPVVGGLDLFG